MERRAPCRQPIEMVATADHAPGPPEGGLCVVSVLIVLLLSGCAANRSVVAVDLTQHTLIRPSGPESLASPEEAVQGIAAIMVRDLGLTVPERVTVYLYSGREV